MSNSNLQLWSQDPVPGLLASCNRRTGQIHFPPVHDSSPLAADYDPVSITGSGTLYSYTVIHPNPKLGGLPRALGYVDLDGVPLRIFGQLRGEHGPALGARYRAVPDDEYGYVFESVNEEAQR